MNATYGLIGCLVLGACGALRPVKDKAVHHLLKSRVDERNLISSIPGIAVRRPSLPVYLDREQLVGRMKGRFTIYNADLWAEPLAAGISRVVSCNMRRLTGSMSIQPVESFTSLEYSRLLDMRVSRFDMDDSGEMIFEGTWQLQNVKGEFSPLRFFHIEVPLYMGTITANGQVDSMSRALEILSRQICGGM
jgi:uncharacterized protein